MSKPDLTGGTGAIIVDRRSGSGEDLTSAEVMRILRKRAAKAAGKRGAVDADWEEKKAGRG